MALNWVLCLRSFGVQRLVEHNNNALKTQGFFDLKRLLQDLVQGRHISRRSVEGREVTYTILCDHMLVSHQNIEPSPARNGLAFTWMKARQKPQQVLFPSVFHYLCWCHLYISSRREVRDDYLHYKQENWRRPLYLCFSFSIWPLQVLTRMEVEDQNAL